MKSIQQTLTRKLAGDVIPMFEGRIPEECCMVYYKQHYAGKYRLRYKGVFANVKKKKKSSSKPITSELREKHILNRSDWNSFS